MDDSFDSLDTGLAGFWAVVDKALPAFSLADLMVDCCFAQAPKRSLGTGVLGKAHRHQGSMPLSCDLVTWRYPRTGGWVEAPKSSTLGCCTIPGMLWL